MTSSSLLIRGGCVLTLGARTPNFARADLLIQDGRIAEIGEDIRSRGAEIVDASDTIVMPGFVDTHRHVWKSLFRNLGVPGSGPAAAVRAEHHRPEDLHAATAIGLLGAVEAGITTVVDWADVSSGAEHLDAVVEAHRASGLRTVLVHPNTVHAAHDGPGRNGFAHASRDLTGDIETLGEDWTTSRSQGLRIHAHAGLPDSPAGVVVHARDGGLLGEDVTLVHCTNLGGADLDAIAASGARVSITPSSEMAGALGSPPIQKLIDRGIRPGLGVDDEQVAPGDLFAQMRAAISIQHAEMFDQKLAGKGGLPGLLTTREVVRYATLDGARAAGLADVTGSLEVGKQADVIVLRADRPNISPVNDPIGAVVWGMDTSNLDWVIVGGRALMRNGGLASDVERARELAIDAQRRVVSSAGLMANAITGETA